MMEIFTIIVLCAAMFGIGVLFGAETNPNKPKKADMRKLDEIPNDDLMMLFMAIGGELERRGMVERMNVTPFDDLEKK